jgi:hypothetical protein
MSLTLPKEVTKRIIIKLLNGQDYRIEVITLLDAEFLQYAIGFFKRVVESKLRNEKITSDWYKKEFLNKELPSDELAIHSGLNKKTISNMYNSANKEIVIEASDAHYEQLYNSIKSVVNNQDELNITLTLKFNKVSVDLDISESLIVINTIAVKRSAIRGSLWSTAGKRVEKPLMQTLCKLYGVKESNYEIKYKKKKNKKIDEFEREIDFYLINKDRRYQCEVKLMGKGNPESADAVIARASDVFIADKLSGTNKNQLNSRKVEWVELRSDGGYKKFKEVLKNLDIPYKDFNGNLNKKTEEIFKEIF